MLYRVYKSFAEIRPSISIDVKNFQNDMALDINLSTVSNGASSSSLMSHRRGMAKSCDIQMTSVFGGAPCPLFQPQYLQSLQNVIYLNFPNFSKIPTQDI